MAVVVGSWFCDRHIVVFAVDLCWSAVVKTQILGIWLALAMVVVDSMDLVHPLANRWLVVLAGLVAVVGLAMVALPLGLLVVLVDSRLQRSYDLALEQI